MFMWIVFFNVFVDGDINDKVVNIFFFCKIREGKDINSFIVIY